MEGGEAWKVFIKSIFGNHGGNDNSWKWTCHVGHIRLLQSFRHLDYLNLYIYFFRFFREQG